MHRIGRLAPPLTLKPTTPLSVPRRFRSSLSTKKTKNAAKTTKQTWNDSVLNVLRLARSHRRGLLAPQTRRSTELKLVNSILEQSSLPAGAEQDLRDVARPMAPHLEEGISELPPGVGPGALVEGRW
jgi:hypothetical protein